MAPRITPSAEALKRRLARTDERLDLLEQTGVPAGQVQTAVDMWLAQHPPASGADGAPGESITGPEGPQGEPGESIQGDVGEQGPQGIAGASVTGPRGEAGPAGASVKGDQGERGPAGESITGPRGETGPQGPPGASVKGDTGERGPIGLTGAAGASVTGPQGVPGAAGAPANTLMGTVVIGQTAVLAIALGNREVTAALAGAVVGGRYQAFCDSYRLNGGASVGGRPSGYALIDTVCNAAGQITVTLSAPLLAIGASYALTCSIVRVNV